MDCGAKQKSEWRKAVESFSDLCRSKPRKGTINLPRRFREMSLRELQDHASTCLRPVDARLNERKSRDRCPQKSTHVFTVLVLACSTVQNDANDDEDDSRDKFERATPCESKVKSNVSLKLRFRSKESIGMST